MGNSLVADLRRESVQAGGVHQYTVNPKQFIFLLNNTNIQATAFACFQVGVAAPDPSSFRLTERRRIQK